MNVEVVRMPSPEQLKELQEQLLLRINSNITAVTVHAELMLALVTMALNAKATA